MKIKLLAVGFALLFLNTSVVFADPDPLVKYDNFNSKKYNGCKYCINSEKWRGGERGSPTEVVREIKSKKLRLANRGWGKSDSNDGREQGRVRAIFQNKATMSGACFTPRVKKYELNTCQANINDTSSVRIRYLGNFYDTDDADEDDTGVVYASIGLQRDVDFPNKKGKFYISAWASECGDEDCNTETWSTYDGTNDPDLFFGTTKGAVNKKQVCIQYDRDNQELVFSYGDDVRIVNQADHGLPEFANRVNADWAWHVIESRTDVENCTPKPITGFVDGDADNVKRSDFPVPP